MFSAVTISLMAIVALICAGLGGCVSEREFKRNMKDPGHMADEIERERRAETFSDMERQNEREEAVRKKDFDEKLERQLRGK